MRELSRKGHQLADDFISSHPLLCDKWDHEYGVALLGIMLLYETNGKRAHFDFVKNSLDPQIDDHGNIPDYNKEAYEVDSIVSGRALLRLYQKSGNEKYKLAAENLRDQFRTHPKASFGNFLHKRNMNEILLIDGIYMGMPFLAEYEAALGSSDFGEVFGNLLTAYRLNYDKESGLMVHGYDATKSRPWADPSTGRSSALWGRGLGWFVVACVDVLDHLPPNYASTVEISRILKELLQNVLRYQHKTGSWFQILDEGEREGNYLEASASAMFTYALCKAISTGRIDESFRANAEQAYNGLLHNFLAERNGRYTLVGTCASAGLEGKPYRNGSFESYACEPTRDNDLKGVGAFFMATAAFDRLFGATNE